MDAIEATISAYGTGVTRDTACTIGIVACPPQVIMLTSGALRCSHGFTAGQTSGTETQAWINSIMNGGAAAGAALAGFASGQPILALGLAAVAAAVAAAAVAISAAVTAAPRTPGPAADPPGQRGPATAADPPGLTGPDGMRAARPARADSV